MLFLYYAVKRKVVSKGLRSREMADAGNPGGSVPENVKMSVTLHWHPLLHGKNHLVRE